MGESIEGIGGGASLNKDFTVSEPIGYATFDELSVPADDVMVAIDQSCYDKCKRVYDNFDELIELSKSRKTDELALICERKKLMRSCGAIIVRTEQLCSVVAGPIFGQRNAEEIQLFKIASQQKGAVTLENAYSKANNSC